MNTVPYSEWKETAHIIHMVTQMMGKVKLERMTPQPEWNHSLIDMHVRGFTTGPIPNGENSFSITLDLLSNVVSAWSSTGAMASFTINKSTSVSECYEEFKTSLDNISCSTDINTTPQEYPVTTPFENQTDRLNYQPNRARDYFEICCLVYNGLMDFSAPFRGKKIFPCLFWGTFDLTTILFAGEDIPFEGDGVIERSAFDERLIEFGFWPGDDEMDTPSLFAMPYPFLTENLDDSRIRPESAYFSSEKMEVIVPLADLINQDDPVKAISNFYHDCYEVITKTQNWPDLNWFNKPLLY